jgi:segregation and condensation protein A
MSSIRVQLQQFEGPLDLLLYLIRKEEMDIFNINIVDITKQYFEYIKLMKEFDIEVAGDFIAMASTLIHIKSKMLLPQYDENGEVVENEDPRKELVQKLLEYEKFKEAAKALYERPLLNRDIWSRGVREKIEVADDEIELEDNALFSLIGSYRKAMKALHKKIHKVNVKLQSISSRIIEMSHYLKPGTTVRMVELFSTQLTERIERSRNALITFLSLLELGKLGFVSLYQTDIYGDIHIQTKKEIEGDVLSKVEEYGNLDAEQISHQLFTPQVPQNIEDDFAETEPETSEDAQMTLNEETEATGMATDEEIAAELGLLENETHAVDSIDFAIPKTEDFAVDEEPIVEISSEEVTANPSHEVTTPDPDSNPEEQV